MCVVALWLGNPLFHSAGHGIPVLPPSPPLPGRCGCRLLVAEDGVYSWPCLFRLEFVVLRRIIPLTLSGFKLPRRSTYSDPYIVGFEAILPARYGY